MQREIGNSYEKHSENINSYEKQSENRNSYEKHSENRKADLFSIMVSNLSLIFSISVEVSNTWFFLSIAGLYMFLLGWFVFTIFGGFCT